MKQMNVLSLCDGYSCGQISLRECGVPVSQYFASEIKKSAIATTTLNFPDTIQLEDLRQRQEDAAAAATFDFENEYDFHINNKKKL